MAYLKEISLALKEIHPYNKNVILLHCTSNYPVRDEDVNLRVIPDFQRRFRMLVGFSDHSTGIEAIPCAVALGARVVEKHFTLNKNMAGPDHHFSVDPEELKQLVEGIRYIEKSMGNSIIIPTKKEMKMREKYLKNI